MSKVEGPVVADLESMIQFAGGGIVSKSIVESERLGFMLFCMEAGQQMSEHTASVPAAIYVVRGAASVRLGDETHQARAGSFFYMPAQLPHAMVAEEDLVFLLVMAR